MKKLTVRSLLIGGLEQQLGPGTFSFTVTLQLPGVCSVGKLRWVETQIPGWKHKLNAAGIAAVFMSVAGSKTCDKYGNFSKGHGKLIVTATVEGSCHTEGLHSLVAVNFISMVRKTLALTVLQTYPPDFDPAAPLLAAGTHDVLNIRGLPCPNPEDGHAVMLIEAIHHAIQSQAQTLVRGLQQWFTRYEIQVNWLEAMTDATRVQICDTVGDLFYQHLGYRPERIWFSVR
ncbi:hypothetical protein KJ596_01245 [Patescibacteria group bacterium]|nr:hypothetical protein [Patescibacteria group bacterium]MBU1868049.1 hypothetical protein [Patescibacteria group bacterium]